MSPLGGVLSPQTLCCGSPGAEEAPASPPGGGPCCPRGPSPCPAPCWPSGSAGWPRPAAPLAAPPAAPAAAPAARPPSGARPPPAAAGPCSLQEGARVGRGRARERWGLPARPLTQDGTWDLGPGISGGTVSTSLGLGVCPQPQSGAPSPARRWVLKTEGPLWVGGGITQWCGRSAPASSLVPLALPPKPGRQRWGADGPATEGRAHGARLHGRTPHPRPAWTRAAASAPPPRWPPSS